MYSYQAKKIVGQPSNPSKMPGYATGIHAKYCITGSKLVKIPGSVCSNCYALKNRYAMPNVSEANERRYHIQMRAIKDKEFRALYIKAWGAILKKEEWHRFLDTGDLQSHGHLQLFVDIATDNPHVHFWMPTREYTLVNTYLGTVPSNLTIRVSAHMVDHVPPSSKFVTSTVHNANAPIGKECGAYTRGGHCGSCRWCWSGKVENVSYPEH